MRGQQWASLLVLAAALGCGSDNDGMTEDETVLGGEAESGNSGTDPDALAPAPYSGWRPDVTSSAIRS